MTANPHLFGRLTLLIALIAAIALAPASGMTGAEASERICLSTPREMAAADACETAAKACCAKHAPAAPAAPTPAKDSGKEPAGEAPSCPCCVHIVQAASALPAIVDAQMLTADMVGELVQPLHLCHASPWIYCEFRPPCL